MTTLTSIDIDPSVARLDGCKTIHDSVTEYCERLGLCGVQTRACLIVAAEQCSAAAGMKTADAIREKMRAIRALAEKAHG